MQAVLTGSARDGTLVAMAASGCSAARGWPLRASSSAEISLRYVSGPGPSPPAPALAARPRTLPARTNPTARSPASGRKREGCRLHPYAWFSSGT